MAPNYIKTDDIPQQTSKLEHETHKTKFYLIKLENYSRDLITNIDGVIWGKHSTIQVLHMENNVKKLHCMALK
jgi:hypothetical protein